MSLFIGLWKQSKNIKSWIINILKVLGRVLWLSNVWLKDLQLIVYWQSTSLLPFPSSKTTKQHKIIIHPSHPPKLLDYHGEKLCRFTILPLSHLLKTWPGPAVMVSVLGYCRTAWASLTLGLDPWRNSKCGTNSLAGRTAVSAHSRRGECVRRPIFSVTWTALLQSCFRSSSCSVVLVDTFLKNSMYCFSIIKVRCFQYQKQR